MWKCKECGALISDKLKKNRGTVAGGMFARCPHCGAPISTFRKIKK